MRKYMWRPCKKREHADRVVVVFLAVVAGDVRNGREEGLQALGRFFWGISNDDGERGMCLFCGLVRNAYKGSRQVLSIKLAMGGFWVQEVFLRSKVVGRTTKIGFFFSWYSRINSIVKKTNLERPRSSKQWRVFRNNGPTLPHFSATKITTGSAKPTVLGVSPTLQAVKAAEKQPPHSKLSRHGHTKPNFARRKFSCFLFFSLQKPYRPHNVKTSTAGHQTASTLLDDIVT